MPGVVRIEREDAQSLDELRELTCSLKNHHAEVAPELGEVRTDDDFWGIKRAQYLHQLAEENGALFVARDEDGAPVGFAFVADDAGTKTWPAPALRVEDLVVAGDARGTGL